MPANEYVIRRATVDDISALSDLLVGIPIETPFFAYDHKKARATIADCITNGYVALAYRDGELAGSIGLRVMTTWYSNAEFIGDKWTYVRPHHRNSHIARELVMLARAVAERMNMALLIDVLSERQTEAKNRLFRRYMTPVGESFMWRPADERRRIQDG